VNKKLKRDVNVHRRDTERHGEEPKPTEAPETKPTAANIRPARSNEEHPESTSPKPTVDIHEPPHKDK
jgi:hypothetical protein